MIEPQLKDAIRSYLDDMGTPADEEGRRRAFYGCFGRLSSDDSSLKDTITFRAYQKAFDEVLDEKAS